MRSGQAAARLSRALGRPGGIIGGRVAAAVDPGLLAQLSTGRRIALVTGTNGKTTTTTMLAAAVATTTTVACNRTGANMPDGALAAFLDDPTAEAAVLEVDESYLPAVIATTRPAVVVLLNLSRDQLDRVAEIQLLARRIGAALLASPGTTVVANAADPLVVAAASSAPRRIWVQPPNAWQLDATACPSCHDEIRHSAEGWSCSGCTLRQPPADWSAGGGVLAGPEGLRLACRLALPGVINEINAAFAVAAAAEFGVAPEGALAAIAGITEVGGRYKVHRRAAGTARVLLAKNPAGWQEALTLMDGTTAGLVIAVNSREADGRDPSWLWDVPFERVRGRRVVAAGDRAADVSVRLAYAEVPHDVVADPLRGADLLGGDVDVVADYTSFVGVRAGLAAEGRARR